MSFTEENHSLRLPNDTRLFHIGPMKTGTTSVQRALFQQREELLEHGVVYPGKSTNHRLAVGAFMGKTVSKHRRTAPMGRAGPQDDKDPAVPDWANWDQLISEVTAAASQRVVISHELAAQADDETAASLIEALGSKTHIVITLRDLASILPSMWTQLLKSGHTTAFDDWLQRVFGLDTERPLPPGSANGLDHAGVVERWAKIASPENVTVVIADSSQPRLVTGAFEQLLGLPTDLLSNLPSDGFTSNRSLRLPEAELLLRINAMSKANLVPWNDYSKMVRGGVVRRLLESRTPGADEPRVWLPQWAAERAYETGQNIAERIGASGVRVVGDVTSLCPVPKESAPSETSMAEIPTDVAAETAAGIMSTALGRRAFFSKPNEKRAVKPDTRPIPDFLANTYSIRELASALKIRLAARVRR